MPDVACLMSDIIKPVTKFTFRTLIGVRANTAAMVIILATHFYVIPFWHTSSICYLLSEGTVGADTF
jgi:hypothetical protein